VHRCRSVWTTNDDSDRHDDEEDAVYKRGNYYAVQRLVEYLSNGELIKKQVISITMTTVPVSYIFVCVVWFSSCNDSSNYKDQLSTAVIIEITFAKRRTRTFVQLVS